MTLEQDQLAREAALNPHNSFIVQAPAGSGKTELLTQRYLKLLAKTVSNPEEIIAITFTRKAASEMRERIISALEFAYRAPQPVEPHKLTTWQLAHEVLHIDKKFSWHLMQNPNRLRILTIDALSAWLNAQIPLLSGFGAKANILEDSQQLYKQATVNLIENPGELKHAVNTLLLHFDNNAEQLSTLLLMLLQKREQWLAHVIMCSQEKEALRPLLEKSLQQIVKKILHNATNALPESDKPLIISLLKSAAASLTQTNPDHILCYALNLDHFPKTDPNDLKHWQALTTLFLARDHSFRNRLDKRLGFPSTKQSEKIKITALLERYRENEHLRQCLEAIQTCPATTYNEQQWLIIDALLQVLPMLCAHLHVLFRTNEATDFVELTLGALRALGDEDSPTDLALYLDYQIKHLLIDEFQDTSILQFSLIEKLTQNWQEKDGRTLFLVGDPMQSIYRFRNAEVGLFLRARSEGLGQLHLTPLTLTHNFRSNPTLVNWVNETFCNIFPTCADIQSGAVTYSPSISAKPPVDNAAIHYLTTSKSDASEIIQTIKNLQQHSPEDSIAILVKSRSHLKAIIPALNEANIKFAAIELEPLAHHQEIIDLISLTKAMLNLADRSAWLALLRAPWCGLTLRDLFILCNTADALPLWTTLLNFETLEALSHDAKARLSKLMPILIYAFNEQGILPLSEWVKSLWVNLDGPQLLTTHDAQDCASRYFELLEEMEAEFSVKYLEEKITTLFAKPNQQLKSTLNIMTIHKSKGLEFDHVIIPELQRQPRAETDELLMWMQTPNEENGDNLVFAPIKASHESTDTIHSYLKRVEKQKLLLESSRLLYVAVTRAKKSLYLHCSLNQNEKGEIAPFPKNSLANLIPQNIQQKFMQNFADKIPSAPPSIYKKTTSPSLRRVPLAHYLLNHQHCLPKTKINHELNHPEQINLKLLHATQFGTAIHEALYILATQGLTDWLIQPTYWQRRLIQIGCSDKSLADKIPVIIQQVLHDPKGRWLLRDHQRAASELAITAKIKNKFQRMIIDRTFIDENDTRWIIDYKTATPSTCESTEKFLNKEKNIHHSQLDSYAQAFRTLEKRKIKLGLYFPLCSAWIAWEMTEVNFNLYS